MNSIGVAFSVAEMKKLDVGRGGAQEDEAKGSRTSTSRGDAAGKQLRGGEARTWSCTACWRAGLEPGHPHLDTVAGHIQLFCCFVKFSQNSNCSQFSTKTKVVQNFKSYKTSLSAQS